VRIWTLWIRKGSYTSSIVSLLSETAVASDKPTGTTFKLINYGIQNLIIHFIKTQKHQHLGAFNAFSNFYVNGSITFYLCKISNSQVGGILHVVSSTLPYHAIRNRHYKHCALPLLSTILWCNIANERISQNVVRPDLVVAPINGFKLIWTVLALGPDSIIISSKVFHCGIKILLNDWT
jgi:hypothetical protein